MIFDIDCLPKPVGSMLKTMKSYSNVIYKYLGYVKEKELIDVFINSNVILLPYKTPGGHSGVLEQAMFFNVSVIAFDFPEYREQSEGNNMVKLIRQEDLGSALIDTLNSITKNSYINIENKIKLVRNNIKSILV